MKSVRVYLGHIRDEINFVLHATGSLSYQQFMQDETLKRACVRSLEIIGEAAKNLPQDYKKKHRQIEWKQLAGLRDKLIHHYFGVDWSILWNVITEKLPLLKVQVDQLLKQK